MVWMSMHFDLAKSKSRRSERALSGCIGKSASVAAAVPPKSSMLTADSRSKREGTLLLPVALVPGMQSPRLRRETNEGRLVRAAFALLLFLRSTRPVCTVRMGEPGEVGTLAFTAWFSYHEYDEGVLLPSDIGEDIADVGGAAFGLAPEGPELAGVECIPAEGGSGGKSWVAGEGPRGG